MNINAEQVGFEAVVFDQRAIRDTFAGGNIPPGRHSLHFAMTFRLHNRTLTGEEVERAVRAVADDCAARFEATLRA